MNKYEQTTEKKKKAIVDTAMDLFANRGFADVSIKEIAETANVSQVSIYNYFGSKEALVAKCADIVMADVLQKSRDILQMDIDYLKKIEMALSFSFVGINLSVSEYFTQKALSDPTLMGLLSKNIDESKRVIFREYIELGKEENIIDKYIPTDVLLHFLDAVNIMGKKLEFNDDITETIKHIHHLVLYGVIGK
ncbi:MAG: TetR/AcrR family transcriptional regulator [Defluviitaleaceae bacterium]|nr:TetR/AcrR family transcriptional regulator [Defluviitaleaceae bacterium]